VAILHQQLDGAKGTIVLADNVGSRVPGQYVLTDGIAVLVGTIDESFVLPSVAP
jgi:hypothetical protein